MLAREDVAAIPGKANLLRGRIVRLKTEAYTELTAEENENLDAVREQLEYIVKTATGKAGPERKIGEIQHGYGGANEAINRVISLHARGREGV